MPQNASAASSELGAGGARRGHPVAGPFRNWKERGYGCLRRRAAGAASTSQLRSDMTRSRIGIGLQLGPEHASSLTEPCPVRDDGASELDYGYTNIDICISACAKFQFKP